MGQIFDSGTGGRGIGRIDADGRVYDDPIAGRGKCIGRVESSGKVFDHSVAGNCIGRLEKDRIYDHSVAGKVIRRVERVLTALSPGNASGVAKRHTSNWVRLPFFS